ncbi:putative HD superfamily hydrolase [Shewanella psychrophila]|uniref:Putative HD superfamily hydrolase n=1 Tax=Shewanella psychrophila TaxID=225848 RepID=A0A1S6HR41_9GAMM|nr:HD domain-containing protein [Shewanella psychrophila]AQS37989.1 putative HD superfamily hydrolase [Shewanella psychrophila]
MIEKYENEVLAFIQAEMTQDQAHDINHVLRVVKTAKSLCSSETAMLEIVLPAAYLHDCFFFPKNHPDRSTSSMVAADKAINFLTSIGYPSEYLEGIHHAIVAHSFSADIKPETIEAQIVQDADRLDAIGAIGIARCLQVGTTLGVKLYSNDDPFCSQRSPDDRKFSIDHFYVKLLRLADAMNTVSAQTEAQNRINFMKKYLRQLETEV